MAKSGIQIEQEQENGILCESCRDDIRRGYVKLAFGETSFWVCEVCLFTFYNRLKVRFGDAPERPKPF